MYTRQPTVPGRSRLTDPGISRHLGSPVEVRLVILSPSGTQRTLVKRLPLLIGRSEEARLRISQDSVSRRHCELLDRDGEVFVRDLNSTNGTLVDGVEIAAETDVPVASGMVVKVGGVSFKVEYGTGGTTVAADVAAASSAATERETVPFAGGEAPVADAVEDVVAGEWPVVAEPSPPDEGDLNEFFKSLS